MAIMATAALVLTATAVLVSPAAGQPRKDMYTDVGILGLTVTNLGYVGNGFTNPNQPSGEYPLNSNVEHLYLGGIWVGAVAADGTIHVSTGAQDASTLEQGDEVREFVNAPGYPVLIWSNSQNSDNYNAAALANQHIQVVFNDYAQIESGNHVPLGLEVTLRALAWGTPYADDFVILDYAIVNISGTELRDVYVGFWNDTTVGNTDNTNPYDEDAAVGWNFYDDMNAAWGAESWVDETYRPEGDPDIWMMWEHDDDGDDGLATSWIGTRLLGTIPEPVQQPGIPPVSYNAWRFRNVPAEDDVYTEGGTELPGKYQLMSNGAFTVGDTEDENYAAASDWVALLSTGPFPSMAAGDTLRVTFGMVCAADSLELLANSRVAQVAYDEGFSIPGGPPSPILETAQASDSIILRWAPGDSLDAEGDLLPLDSPLRSPEQHISTITGKPDFQGYRIYRYQGLKFTEDPFSQATLVAQYDKVDGIGFDTDLPPLDEQGQREFVDTNLLDGFPYWYSVISFSAPDLTEGLPEYVSGFNENAQVLYPGPGAANVEDGWRVGVYPNPYRTGSLFENPIGERELSRRIWFTGLTPRCRLEIFTLAGERVRTIEHDDPNSGQVAWDLLSDYSRAIATGLYIYVVTDHETGDVRRGKLVIIK